MQLKWMFVIPLFLIVLFVGCAENTENLAFETVDKGYTKFYGMKDMEFVVIKSKKELNSFLREYNLSEKIEFSEFDRYILIATFQGLQSSAGYDIEIKDVRRDGETVTVKVKLRTPKPDEITADVLTSPYHIVKVKREALLGVKTFTFVDQNGKPLKKLTIE